MTVATTVSPASRAGVVQRQGQHGQDLVAVDDLAGGVDGQARSASPSWAIPASAPCSTTAADSTSRWVEPQPSLMFSPSGSAPIAMTSAPARRSRPGAKAARGAVRAVHDDAAPGQRRSGLGVLGPDSVDSR